jgi:hypothetical protein
MLITLPIEVKNHRKAPIFAKKGIIQTVMLI